MTYDDHHDAIWNVLLTLQADKIIKDTEMRFNKEFSLEEKTAITQYVKEALSKKLRFSSEKSPESPQNARRDSSLN